MVVIYADGALKLPPLLVLLIKNISVLSSNPSLLATYTLLMSSTPGLIIFILPKLPPLLLLALKNSLV
jgi:hypothetical protein